MPQSGNGLAGAVGIPGLTGWTKAPIGVTQGRQVPAYGRAREGDRGELRCLRSPGRLILVWSVRAGPRWQQAGAATPQASMMPVPVHGPYGRLLRPPAGPLRGRMTAPAW